ncbi:MULTISPECIES: sporulation integral membrane protein YtvI [Pontibacillus]|uniref:Sporulation integral membrane protein YtvI n=1 Tax=Pontibacillus chungwhensis TaxID=265426 RepID=A0ABY8UXS0_9BACI|nr:MULTISPECIES: sporulation integral membrane protein YtvI [Pontibacillus]MCD5323834.1 sporulation integral membrane protein YtvI [Pontibacillus sp. HN14]WIF97195.1 sporulation integral membrane protein YtvI [Pontibacillus chungwhensis]
MDQDQVWLILARVIRSLLVGIILISAIYATFLLWTYLYPFIIALCIAYLINPLVTVLEKRLHTPRSLAVFIAILLLLGAIIGIITLLVVELIDGFTYLGMQLPDHFKTLISYLENLLTYQIVPLYERLTSFMNTLDASQQQEIITQIQNVGANIAQSGAELLGEILNAIPSYLKKLPNFATVLIFSLLGTFFISKDWYKLGRRIKQFTPSKVAESGVNVFDGLQKALLGFVKAQFTLISITAFIVLLGLLILRVEYAVTIAILTGAVDLLPYLGTGFVFVPWIVYMFFTGNYFLTIGLSILYTIVIIQRQMMEPKVLSSNIGLDPLATLMALFVGFQLFGFLGLIIGPVSLVIINTLHQSGVFKEIWGYIIGKTSSL